MSTVNFPIIYIPDPVKGRPIFNGQLYIGVIDLDPKIPASQEQVFFVQENGDLIAASQPIVLSAGGVPVYNGTPVTLYVAGEYSMRIDDKLGAQIYYIARTSSTGSDSVITHAEVSKTLSSGQLIVEFPGITAARANVHIGTASGDRGKLFEGVLADYTVTGGSEITLTSSFNAGTEIIASSSEIKSVVDFGKKHLTLNNAVIDADLIKDDAINLKERTTGNGGTAIWDAVDITTVTPNTYNIVACTGNSALALVLRSNTPNFYPQWGGDQLALIAAVAASKNCDLLGQTVELTANYTMPIASTIRNGTIKLNPGVDFRGDAVCRMIDLDIDANGADYGIQEVVTVGVTNGMKTGLIDNVRVQNAAISDVFLAGYHFLLKINRLLCYSATATSFGLDLGNVDGILNPDIKITNTYVNGPAFGMRLRDGSFHVSSSSADGCTAPIESNNAFVLFDSCGFEQFNRASSVGSSQIILNQCTMSTKSGVFDDDSGQRAFMLSGGGTIAASIEMNGGIYQNNSDDVVYLIRGLPTTLSKTLKIGRDVERRPVGNELRSFIYSSTGAQSIEVAKICHLGDRNTVPVFGGKDPVGTTIFPIEVAKDTTEYCPASVGTVRYAIWRETGTVAGASTTVDFVIYNSDGTERLRVASAISVAGTTIGQPNRFGAVILDEPVEVDEFVQWENVNAGSRATTGFTISMVVDE